MSSRIKAGAQTSGVQTAVRPNGGTQTRRPNGGAQTSCSELLGVRFRTFLGRPIDCFGGPRHSTVIPKIPRAPKGLIPPPLVYRLYLFNCETHIESKYAIH